jgi:hypothetical protein
MSLPAEVAVRLAFTVRELFAAVASSERAPVEEMAPEVVTVPHLMLSSPAALMVPELVFVKVPELQVNWVFAPFQSCAAVTLIPAAVLRALRGERRMAPAPNINLRSLEANMVEEPASKSRLPKKIPACSVEVVEVVVPVIETVPLVMSFATSVAPP